MKKSQSFPKSFIKLFLKLRYEVTSLMDFGSSFHERCPVARRHLTKSKSLQFLVALLWIC